MDICDEIIAPDTCPSCGGPVRNVDTRYGLRSSCEPCGLHAWDGKELVSQAVHDARKAAHAAFDPIWQNAERAYPDGETMSNRQRKKVRRAMRNRAYEMLAELTGIPEPEYPAEWIVGDNGPECTAFRPDTEEITPRERDNQTVDMFGGGQ